MELVFSLLLLTISSTVFAGVSGTPVSASALGSIGILGILGLSGVMLALVTRFIQHKKSKNKD